MKVTTRSWSSPPESGTKLYMWCPGCDELHGIEVDKSRPSSWDWDGNREAPTISPSIKVGGVQWGVDDSFHKASHHVKKGEPTTCHSFVRNGRWEFLGDCTHNLAGQTVEMVELPECVSTRDYLGGNR